MSAEREETKMVWDAMARPFHDSCVDKACSATLIKATSKTSSSHMQSRAHASHFRGPTWP